jgi:hypothetical protein
MVSQFICWFARSVTREGVRLYYEVHYISEGVDRIGVDVRNKEDFGCMDAARTGATYSWRTGRRRLAVLEW